MHGSEYVLSIRKPEEMPMFVQEKSCRPKGGYGPPCATHLPPLPSKPYVSVSLTHLWMRRS